MQISCPMCFMLKIGNLRNSRCCVVCGIQLLISPGMWNYKLQIFYANEGPDAIWTADYINCVSLNFEFCCLRNVCKRWNTDFHKKNTFQKNFSLTNFSKFVPTDEKEGLNCHTGCSTLYLSSLLSFWVNWETIIIDFLDWV